HNGDLELAKKTIDAAVEAGADAVKFQNYRTEDFISNRNLTYEYFSQGRRVIEAQYDMFKRCELTPEFLQGLKEYCDLRGIGFHSTPTSKAGIDNLVRLGSPLLKNGSDYLTNLPLITYMGQTGLPTVLSTGMATLAEIDDAVRAFRATGNNQLILLHCTSAYPTPEEEVHLRKIPTLEAAFGCLVGFSDHTKGCIAAVGAVALGACWLEKHFTLDKNLPGPDHRFSADPFELKALVEAIRSIEKNLGTAGVGPTATELENRQSFRLSCVAAHELPIGHRLVNSDISFRRPGTGLPPKAQDWLVDRTLKRGVASGHIFQPEDFE
ncbi:MAG: N-acetylneuraminate synthase, partial [Moorea sp. SIO3I7]|nr:N-acetylneuraminate synthase [Moorena sp. SIO3I7]